MKYFHTLTSVTPTSRTTRNCTNMTLKARFSTRPSSSKCTTGVHQTEDVVCHQVRVSGDFCSTTEYRHTLSFWRCDSEKSTTLSPSSTEGCETCQSRSDLLTLTRKMSTCRPRRRVCDRHPPLLLPSPALILMIPREGFRMNNPSPLCPRTRV